jgi:hypothetical protein
MDGRFSSFVTLVVKVQTSETHSAESFQGPAVEGGYSIDKASATPSAYSGLCGTCELGPIRGL